MSEYEIILHYFSQLLPRALLTQKAAQVQIIGQVILSSTKRMADNAMDQKGCISPKC